MSDWKLSFRYWKGSDIDIWVHSDIRKTFNTSAGFKPKTLVSPGKHLTSPPLSWSMILWMSDIGYRIKVYSDIRYNVGLHQSDIGSSDIKLSPISLDTDIGVSAHLCSEVKCNTYREASFRQDTCRMRDPSRLPPSLSSSLHFLQLS